MIGAVILKLALRGAMNDLNNRRKEKIIANYANDAVIIYPGKFSMSGTPGRARRPSRSSSTSISTRSLRRTAWPERPTSRTSSRWA